MNNIPNRQAICDTLLAKAENDKNIVVLCSDSRGSASLAAFADKFPAQFVEVGIAEQNLVSIAAGLAKCGKKAFAASPACFLSTRSFEQIKVDVAYANANVTLIGISGGVSYGALGMTHHSAQDIAALAAVPNMRVYIPSDRFQTKWLIDELLKDDKPAYVRVGRNPVADIYGEGSSHACRVGRDAPGCLGEQHAERVTSPGAPTDCTTFEFGKAVIAKEGTDVAIIACGEMVKPALGAAEILAQKGVSARVIDMYCLKPLDESAVLDALSVVKKIVTVEEHSPHGGLGAMVSQIAAQNTAINAHKHAVPVVNLALPDSPVVAGTSAEILAHYGLTAEGIAGVCV